MFSIPRISIWFPKRLAAAALWGLLAISGPSATAQEMPLFLPDYAAPLLADNGEPMRLLDKHVRNGVDTHFYQSVDGITTLLLERVPCDRPNCNVVFRNVLVAINRDPTAVQVVFKEVEYPDAQATLYRERQMSNLMVFRMPAAVNIFSYRQALTKNSSTEKIREGFLAAYRKARMIANRQRYETMVAKNENIELGEWAGSFRKYALELLAAGAKQDALAVLGRAVAAAPYDLESHRILMEHADDAAIAGSSAEIIYRGTESVDLYARAARFLERPVTTTGSVPYIGKVEDRLQLILVPLGPIDLDLLAEAAKTYEKITAVPATIRRLRVPWVPGNPDRPFLIYNGQIVNFSGKPAPEFLADARNAASNDALQHYSLDRFARELDSSTGQYDAQRLMKSFLADVANHIPHHPRTMIVGVTSLNIFGGNARYVFSSYTSDSRAVSGSILSYAMLKAFPGEPQSRRRLADRLAKELVPASLKRLGIPRATDPTDPYSYANGPERVDQKSLTLSKPVVEALAKFR